MKHIVWLSLIITFGCDREEAASSVETATTSVAPSASASPREKAAAESPSKPTSDEPAFEGEVDLVIETKSPKAATVKATMLLDSGKMRMNLDEPAAGGGASQIIDTKSGKMISLAHGPKIAMDMSMSGILGSLAPWMPADEKGDPEHPAIKKTDRTETIAGHECRYYDYSFKGGQRGSVCLANLGVGWVHLGGIEEAKWAQQAFEGNRFPLKYENFDKAGKEASTMTVTRLQKKSIPDSEFEVPAGYKRMDGSKLMEGLLPAMMPPAGSAGTPRGKMPKAALEMLEKMKQGQK